MTLSPSQELELQKMPKRRGRPLSLDTKLVPTPAQRASLAGWGVKAELVLRLGMTEREWGYRELAAALEAEGLKVSATVLNRRVNRGNFSAAFFMACLAALGNEDDVVSVINETKVARNRARSRASGRGQASGNV